MKPRSTFQPAILSILLFALVLAAADVLVVSASILLLVFAGILFGVFLNSLARWVTDHTSLRYPYSYLLIVAAMFLLFGLGIFYLGSQAVQRVDELRGNLRSATEQAAAHLQQYEWADPYLADTSSLHEMVAKQGTVLLPTMWGGLQSVVWVMTCALVIFFVGLYGSFDPNLYRDGFVTLVPCQQRRRACEVLDKLRFALGRWIVGRLMSMTIVGVLTAIGLWLLHVPLAGTLGVVAALLTFIPNFGPILAAVPQVLLALNVGSNTVVYVLVFNIILQGVESYLITPIIQKHEVQLPPILTIAAQLMLGALVGVIGVMMAAPLIVVIMVLVQTLYVHDQLSDPPPETSQDAPRT